MNYNLQRAINELRPTIFNRPYPRLYSDPAVTLTYPGIGQSIKIHSMIVPLRGSKIGNYEVKKKVDDAILQEEVIGSGKISLTDVQDTEISDQPKDKASLDLKTDSLTEPNISEGLKYSFLHPKIEIGKVVYPKKSDQEKKRKLETSDGDSDKKAKILKGKSPTNHKFQFY